VQQVAGRRLVDVDVDHHELVQAEELVDEPAVEAHAVRRRALQAQRIAPVVEHRPRGAGGDEQHRLGLEDAHLAPHAGAPVPHAADELLGEGNGSGVCAGASVAFAVWSTRAHLASDTDAK
jgi:hypothetical protein